MALSLNDCYRVFKLQVLKNGDNLSYPKKGNTLRVHYEAFMAKSGKKFDSSRDRNETFEFVLGSGQVIEGWEQILPKMSIGETVRFTLPTNYAYGKSGLPGLVPPGADLNFEVELISYE